MRETRQSPLTDPVNKPEAEQTSLNNLQGRWNMFASIPTADVCPGSRIKTLMYLFPLWSTNLPLCGQLWWFSTGAPTPCGFCKKKKKKKGFGCKSLWRIMFCRLQDTHSVTTSQRWTCFLRRGNKKENPNHWVDWKRGKWHSCQLSATKRELKFGTRKTENHVWRCWRSLSTSVQLQALSGRFVGGFYRKS